jgi:hypothetical protein
MLFERKDNNNFPNTKIKNHDISEQAHNVLKDLPG